MDDDDPPTGRTHIVAGESARFLIHVGVPGAATPFDDPAVEPFDDARDCAPLDPARDPFELARDCAPFELARDCGALDPALDCAPCELTRTCNAARTCDRARDGARTCTGAGEAGLAGLTSWGS